MVVENVKEVQKNIAEACRKAGRDPAEVQLIAVSKTKPVSLIREVYDMGIREFGENYVQELDEKVEQMPADIHWHMIGHLQRNKVKNVVGKVCMIHSVDSLRLAGEISKESMKKGIVTDVLVEVNVAGEENKFGFSCEDTEEFIREAAPLKGIRICGLMTSAPYVENPEDNRCYFRKLRELCVDINKKNIDNVSMKALSMGMTNDYIVAVEEGATMVRVGTAIFGARQYR